MKLKSVVNSKGQLVGYTHWCAGCRSRHMFNVSVPGEPPSRPCWTFDGNMEKPTFSPSMRSYRPACEVDGVKYPEVTLCHYFLRAGEIEYLNDSTLHSLRGKHPLMDIPTDG